MKFTKLQLEQLQRAIEVEVAFDRACWVVFGEFFSREKLELLVKEKDLNEELKLLALKGLR